MANNVGGGKILRDGVLYGTGETATTESDGLMSAEDKKKLESQSFLNAKEDMTLGANLDDYTQTGIYYLNGVDILNDGVKNWGFMLVFKQGNTVVQLFFGTQHQIYTRAYAGSPLKWSDWYKATTSIA